MRSSVFELEQNLVERCREALDHASPEEARLLLAELTGAYAKLLRQTEKITRVGDSIQNKLVKAHEEILRQNEQLQVAQRQLLHKEKMVAMTTFVQGLAHEICNPLNFITNFAHVNLELCGDIQRNLSRVNEPSVRNETEHQLEDLHDGARIILEHGRRAAAIVESMSKLIVVSRSGQGVQVAQDLNYMLNNFALPVTRYFNSLLDGRLVVHSHLCPSLPLLEVLVEDIGTVFTQLLTNAGEALLARKQVDPSFEPQITLTSNIVDDRIRIHIDDNGEGIANSLRDKIFTPFFSTRGTATNIGLGLTTSYDILVNGYNGDLRLEDCPGVTRFTAEFPISTKIQPE